MSVYTIFLSRHIWNEKFTFELFYRIWISILFVRNQFDQVTWLRNYTQGRFPGFSFFVRINSTKRSHSPRPKTYFKIFIHFFLKVFFVKIGTTKFDSNSICRGTTCILLNTLTYILYLIWLHLLGIIKQMHIWKFVPFIARFLAFFIITIIFLERFVVQ